MVENLLVRAACRTDCKTVTGYYYQIPIPSQDAKNTGFTIMHCVLEVAALQDLNPGQIPITSQFYEVNPSTICRCLGIKDYNGKFIWEGDKVRTKYGRICKVVWKQTDAFMGWDLEPCEALDKKAPTEWDLWYCGNLEVVQ